MKVSTRISSVISPEIYSEKTSQVNKKAPKLMVWSTFVLLAFFMISSNVSLGQVAAWTFDATAAAPNTPTSITANLGTQTGTATLYADGTNGSSSWVTASGATNELTTFGGATTNDPRGTPVAGNAYTPVAATGFTANGKKMVFKFSMTSLQNPIITYATRNTATGFQTQQWAWSIDNTTYTDFSTVTGLTTSFATKTLDMTAINAVDNVTTVYLRVTFTGATNASGNNRVDNVVINASPFALTGQTITGFPLTDSRAYGIGTYNITGVTGGGSGNPVTFVSDNNSVASVSGTTVTVSAVGTANITASQAGNGSYSAAPDVIQALTVTQASQTITFGALINRNDIDANFQLTATGGGSGNPVTYTSSNTAVCQIVDINGNLDPNGSYVDIVGPGTTTITASQAGNTNYAAATPVPQLQTIINTNLLNQAITFGPLANGIYGGANFQLTATGGGSGNPVTYTSTNTSVATIVDINGNLDPNGSYVDIVGPGTTSIKANQAGNGSYNAASEVAQSFTVDVKPLTVSNAVADDKVYDAGTAATISGATLNGIETADIGQVSITGFAGTFADPNVNVGPPISVTANLTLGGAAAGKYSLTQPTGLSANITKANQTITFNALADKSPGDANFSLTATASSGLPVSYSSNNSAVASVTGDVVHIGVLGAATITATQAGGQNYFAAAAVQQTQNVVPPTPVSIFANLINDPNPSLGNPFTTGQTFNSNITVSGIGRGSGIVGTSAGNRYNANAWNVASLDPNKYFEFTLTPNSGYRIDFSSFTYNSQVSTATINGFAVRSSVDGFTTNIGTPTSGTSATLSTIPLTAGAYQGITTPITFRVYAWGATVATTTFSINDFIFNGNVFVAPPTATYTKTNVSVCGGTNDGSITVTPSGTGPFSYSWTGVTGSGNPANTPFTAGNVNPVTNLPIGYYNVTVTDGNSNTVTITGIHIENAFSVYITNNGSISSSCAPTGSIILYGNSGVQPYTYSVVPGNNPSGTYQVSNTFTDLAAGSYTAYVKDAAGCVNSKSITVAAAAAITVSPYVRPASSCGADGVIEVYRSGGIPPYTYSKDGGTTYQPGSVFSALAAGSYTIFVKDSKGCTGQATVSVTQGAALTVTASKTNTSLCVNDGSIQVNASGGVGPYTYQLDAGSFQSSNVYTDLAATTYVVTVKDSKGCTGTLNVTINLNPITVTAYVVPASSCASSNGSIQLFRTGGVGPYSYYLDSNSPQSSPIFTGLIPGYYTGYVQDSKGCTGQLLDIYVGPDCGQRQIFATKGADANSANAKVVANTEMKAQAYPNPSATEFILSLEGYSNAKVSVTVTDVMGRIVYRTEGTGKQQYRFGNNLKAGLYNVQVLQGNDKKSLKLVKQ